jgi:site-specific recombinase XerD
MVTLDDIHFRRREIILRNRGKAKTFRLPICESTIKAIAAYMVVVRPQTNSRTLFLALRLPYEPLSPASVSNEIRHSMRKAKLPFSAYPLRHTYVQNLLERGASSLLIKQVLGHEGVQSAENYLKIHVKLMRQVLFDEIL